MNAAGLISPYYHLGESGYNWCLLRLSISRLPPWAKIVFDHQRVRFWFREIAYLNQKNEVEGLGRSWLPITFLGTRIFLSCLNPFNPTPVGSVIGQMYNGDLQVELNGKYSFESILAPYRVEKELFVSFQRVIKQKSTNSVIVVTEEDFLESATRVPHA